MYYKDIIIDSWVLDVKIKKLNFTWVAGEIGSVLNYNWVLEWTCIHEEFFKRRLDFFNYLKEAHIFWDQDMIYPLWLVQRGKNTVFVKTKLYNESNTPKDMFINIRSVVKNKTILFESIKKWQHIIQTLQCLFWKNGIEAILKNWDKMNFMASKNRYSANNPIVSFSWDSSLTLYEYESLIRNIYLINHIINEWTIKELRISMPKIAYYYYGMKLFQEWFCDKDALLQYIAIIDNKIQKINDIFSKRFIDISLSFDSPLAELEAYMKNCMTDERQFDLSEIKDILSTSKIWDILFKIHQDMNIDDIFWARGEAIEEIKTSIDNEWKIGILIKNPKEEQSLTICNDITRKFSREFGWDFSLVWIYASELINIDGLNSLYNIWWNNWFGIRKKFLNDFNEPSCNEKNER